MLDLSGGVLVLNFVNLVNWMLSSSRRESKSSCLPLPPRLELHSFILDCGPCPQLSTSLGTGQSLPKWGPAVTDAPSHVSWGGKPGCSFLFFFLDSLLPSFPFRLKTWAWVPLLPSLGTLQGVQKLPSALAAEGPASGPAHRAPSGCQATPLGSPVPSLPAC